MFFYLLFGLVGLVCCFVVVPLLALTVRDKRSRQRVTRALIQRLCRAFVWLAHGMGIISIRFAGLEHVNLADGQLVLASHPTLIDVVLLLSVLPQVDCVVKDAVMRNPVLGAVARTADYVSNRDPEQMLRECEERLRRGASLLLFPEGTRSIAGEPVKLKLGAAEIAVRAKASILPVVIECKPQILGKHQPWFFVPLTKAQFAIQVLQPVHTGTILDAGADGRPPRYRVNDFLRDVFTRAPAANAGPANFP